METESPSGDLSSTQPLSPTGIELRDDLQHVDRDDASGDDDNRAVSADTKETTSGEGAAPKSKKVASKQAPITKTSVKVASVAWTDHLDGSDSSRSYDGQGLTFRVMLDTSRRTGLFKLQANIQLKHMQLKHNDLLAGSQIIYLFIYPENVLTVTGDEPLYTLTFSLRRPPDLVVPKGKPLESEPATDALLESMFALAKSTKFVIQLPTAALPRKDVKLISSIACVLSANHDISTDKRRADLNPLYLGDGGEIVQLDKETQSIAESPPTYEKPPARLHNKLKRKCTSPDVERRRATTSGRASSKAQAIAALLEGGNVQLEDIYNLLVEVNGRVTRIEGDVKQIQSRVDQIESHVERIGSRVEQVDSRVEQIEKSLASEGSEAPSQTMSEARLELLEELNDRIDHEIIDVQSRYADVTEELEEKITEFETTMSEALEDFQRNAEDCEQEVEERIERAVDKYLSDGTFQGSFFFNKQAIADQ
ncbi:hypothetical protein A9Z42_0003880 [Trichoderma parareesei]|uniref:Uncharacterized protein n=1 Tax=Trichoderma parareesei TaxID=858221 RepID=A0A2H3AA28_TRIPA|nr:hypothetical protein A9Z42_0003880 [Trichoderma parareesei]